MPEQVLPGLYRIIVPLPKNPLKEINSYVLVSDDRNLIIDTGMNRPECREALESALDELRIDLGRTDFFITHLHADHMGMVSGLLREGSRAYMGEADALRLRSGNTPHVGVFTMADFARANGFPEDELQAAMASHPGVKFGPAAIVDYHLVREGDIFRVGDYTLQAIATPGHSEGHTVLYDRERKMLFSGDHVLGDITPNIQAWFDGTDPLGAYIQSLKKVLDLEVELCLPGHRSFISDFRGRILELIEHHRVRANETLAIVEREPATPYVIASRMTWDIRADSWDDFPVSQKWFAVGEGTSHLLYLENRGMVRREVRSGLNVFCGIGADPL